MDWRNSLKEVKQKIEDEPVTFEEIQLRYLISGEPELVTKCIPDVYECSNDFSGAVPVRMHWVEDRDILMNARVHNSWYNTGTNHRKVSSPMCGARLCKDTYIRDAYLVKLSNINIYEHEYEVSSSEYDYARIFPQIEKRWK